MQRVSSFRPAFVRAGLPILALAMATSLSMSHAFAQASECDDIGKKLNAYGALMQRAQSFQKKKPTPDEACAVFRDLFSAGEKVVPALKQNGAWCHVPDNIAANIEAQQPQIAKVRTNACGVAAQMKKQQQQQQQGPGLLGGGEVLGGPMRVPQGAL